MVGFVDRALVRFTDAAALAALLSGGGPPPYPQLARLIDNVFPPEGTRVHAITGLTVNAVTPMVPLATRRRFAGTLQTTQPAFAMTDVRGELTNTIGTWVQLLARISIHVVIEVDPGGVQSVITRAVENITSLDDFASRFRYLDLPAFLAARHITTVEQLREAAEYILTELTFASPPPFDPADPANGYDVELDLAVAVHDNLDLAAGLQSTAVLREAGSPTSAAPRHPLLGVANQRFAVAVLFPQSALGAGEPTPTAIDALYGTAGVLPLFASPL